MGRHLAKFSAANDLARGIRPNLRQSSCALDKGGQMTHRLCHSQAYITKAADMSPD